MEEGTEAESDCPQDHHVAVSPVVAVATLVVRRLMSARQATAGRDQPNGMPLSDDVSGSAEYPLTNESPPAYYCTVACYENRRHQEGDPHG